MLLDEQSSQDDTESDHKIDPAVAADAEVAAEVLHCRTVAKRKRTGRDNKVAAGAAPPAPAPTETESVVESVAEAAAADMAERVDDVDLGKVAPSASSSSAGRAAAPGQAEHADASAPAAAEVEPASKSSHVVVDQSKPSSSLRHMCAGDPF